MCLSQVSSSLHSATPIVLFRALKLERLARLTGAEKAIAHETHFDVSSPIITDLWEQFQRSYKLKELFPLVEDQYGLWAAIRSCMRFMGYEDNSCNIRVATFGLQLKKCTLTARIGKAHSASHGPKVFTSAAGC